MAQRRTSIDPSDYAGVLNEDFSVDSAVTASATSNQAGGYPITASVTRVATAASAGDSLTLPPAVAGERRTVFNKAAANSIDIFPSPGDAINAIAADGAYALAVTKGVTFFCAEDGQWDTILTA